MEGSIASISGMWSEKKKITPSECLVTMHTSITDQPFLIMGILIQVGSLIIIWKQLEMKSLQTTN